MKLDLQAVATLLLSSMTATANVSSSSFRTMSVQEIQRRLQQGTFDQERLMRHAIPYNQVLLQSSARDLEEEQGDNQQDGENNDNGNGNNYKRQYNQYNQYTGQVYTNNNQVNNNNNNNNNRNNNNNNNQVADDDYTPLEITGNYRLQFNKCVSLKTQNYNLLLENLVYYTQAGAINSIRNYVLFDVCQVNNCYYQEGDTSNVYMVDLNTFINSVIDRVPEEQERYCQACEEYQDYCRPDDAAGGGNRRLENNNKNKGYKLQTLDCKQCEAYGCYEAKNEGNNQNNNGDANGNENNQVDYEEIAEWVKDMTQCKLMDGYWNGLYLFAGWTCNSDGSGIEIGVFLDANCRIHHNTLNYAKMLGNYQDEALLVEQSQNVVPLMFDGYIDCADNEVQYYVQGYDNNKNGNNNDKNNNDKNEGNENEVPEASEICRRLFEGGEGKQGGSVPRSISDCDGSAAAAAAAAAQNNYVEEDDAFGDDSAQDEQGGGNAQQAQGGNSFYYDDSWYQFDLSVQDIKSKLAVCQVMANKFLSKEGIDNVYNEDSAGSVYNYNNNGNKMWESYESKSAKSSRPSNMGLIVVIVLVAVAFAVLIANIVVRRLRKKKKEREIVLLGTDHNKSPLIIA